MLCAAHAIRRRPLDARLGSLMSREAADALICVVDKRWFLREVCAKRARCERRAA